MARHLNFLVQKNKELSGTRIDDINNNINVQNKYQKDKERLLKYMKYTISIDLVPSGCTMPVPYTTRYYQKLF